MAKVKRITIGVRKELPTFLMVNAFIMSLLTIEKVGKTLRKYFFQILRHGLFSDANIKIERVKNNEIHCVICSIESVVLYLYQIKFKAYEIILFKCRTD